MECYDDTLGWLEFNIFSTNMAISETNTFLQYDLQLKWKMLQLWTVLSSIWYILIYVTVIDFRNAYSWEMNARFE